MEPGRDARTVWNYVVNFNQCAALRA